MKTSELTGAALDWAVANLENVPVNAPGYLWGVGQFNHRYSTDWAQGGPIIERERIGVLPSEMGWQAGKAWEFFESESFAYHREYGPTPLIAAMRCYVASKLGDEVEIPEELK